MRKRILYHLHTNPMPVDGGDRARISGILNYFKARKSSLVVDAFGSSNCIGWRVKYGVPTPNPWRESVDFVLESAEHLFIHEKKYNLAEYLYSQAARRYYSWIKHEMLPADTEIAVSRSYASFVRRLVNSGRYDYLWTNFVEYARLGLVAAPRETQRVIDIHDLASAAKHSKKDLPEFEGLTFDFDRNLAREMNVLNKFDKIAVNSTEELKAIGHHIAKEKLYLVPHLVEPSLRAEVLPDYGSREFRYDLLYVGSNQSWNVKAINSFIAGALPAIVQAHPGVRVGVLGKVGAFIRVPDDLRGNVEASGKVVPSLEGAYLASRIVICPLLEGAGTKLKLSEAISYRVPIVTTSVGASGLLVSDGVHCLVRDRQEDFAAGVIRLLREPEEAMRMSKELDRLYERAYSRSVIFSSLDQLLGIS